MRHVALAVIALPIELSVVVGQPATTSEIMLRVHAYVVGYEHDLSGIVADERWEQRIVGRDGATKRKRVLRSDYLVYQLPPDEEWFGFRDVVEVDGAPVSDREERFRDLLALKPTDVVEQAMKIAAESARYNLGDLYRTINVPTFVLQRGQEAHLHPEPKGRRASIARSPLGGPDDRPSDTN